MSSISVLLLTLLWAISVTSASPWVYSDNEDPPEGTIRVTVLGSGTPDVRRHQVKTLSHSSLFCCAYARTVRHRR